MRFSSTTLALFLNFMVTQISAKQTVYMIRHGEKPADDDMTGLSSEGVARAQCLSKLFVPPAYNIGKIRAQTPKKDGTQGRPALTIGPLAEVLDLTVDISCDRDDQNCVAGLVDKYGNEDNGEAVLICWEHDNMTPIAKALGVKHAPDYPNDRFDVIWLIDGKHLVTTESEVCPGLD